MARWFRFYEDTINDPKVLRLSDELYRAWTILLCFASKHDGKLPPADDIAVALRVKPPKVCEWITKLVKAGLIDQTETGFEPHNWNGRQYKSDVSTDRVKRFRQRKGNVSSAVPETPPDTDTDTDTDSEPKGSGADAPNPRSKLLGEGLKKLGELTGKSPDSCRSFIGKCLHATNDDASVVLGLIDDAHRNRVANAPAWISSRLKSAAGPSERAPPMTIEQAVEQYARIGQWSRHAPLSDVSQAPTELLAKHGLGPDGRKLQRGTLQ